MRVRLKRYRAKDRTFALCMEEMRHIAEKRETTYFIKMTILTHVPSHLMEAIETQCKLEGLL